MLFRTPHSGRLPGAFYWLFGLSLLVTGGPAVPLLFGKPHPVKFITLLVLGTAFTGMAWLMWYYHRSFNRLSYELTGTGIIINWGKKPVVIPYHEITAVAPWKLKGASRVYGMELGGYRQGVFSIYRLGKGEFYAVGDEVVLIQTGDNLYGITPADRDGFMSALKAKLQEKGVSYSEQVTKQATKAKTGSSLDGWTIAGLVVGFGLILGMALAIYVLTPRLPEQIPMHYNLRGEVNRYGPPEELYIMPAIALVTWFPTVVIGLALTGDYPRIRRFMVALAAGLVLFIWGTLLAMVLPLLR